jgi:hypothetical protein
LLPFPFTSSFPFNFHPHLIPLPSRERLGEASL